MMCGVGKGGLGEKKKIEKRLQLKLNCRLWLCWLWL